MRSGRALALISILASCDDVVPAPSPDAAGPALHALWDPRVCDGDPRARIQIRVADSAGVAELAEAPCAACTVAVAVPHVGWYWANAIVLDRDGGGRVLAASTIAIDGPAVRWQVPW
jgi:hypothetical protein